LVELAPKGERRMGANPTPTVHFAPRLADAGLPRLCGRRSRAGARGIGDVHVLGPFLRDVAKLNNKQRNFRVFGRTKLSPTASKRFSK